MSVSELATLGSLYKYWRNTDIFSGKRVSFYGRKLIIFLCKEDQGDMLRLKILNFYL